MAAPRRDPYRKCSQAEVQYRPRPSGLMRCGDCDMYRAPASCTSVIAVPLPISPAGYCVLFEAISPDHMGT